MLGHHAERRGGPTGPGLRGVGHLGAEDTLKPEPQHRFGGDDRRRQRVGVGAAQLVGIGPLGQPHHLDGQVKVLLPGIDALGRRLTRRVGIEGQHHLVDVARQQLEVLLGEAGAAGGHRLGHPCAAKPDHIGVALADHHPATAHRILTGPVQPVQQATLVVEVAVAGVLVFGALLPRHDAAAETHRMPLGVEDGKQHPRPKEVLQASGLVGETQACGGCGLAVEAKGLAQHVPAVGCPADAIPLHLVGIEAPTAQVRACSRRVGRGLQPLVVELHRLLHPGQQALALLAGGRLGPVGVGEGDAGLCGQTFDRLDEVQALQLPQERDGVARNPTAKAVVQAFGLVHRERRRLLGMKRAQPGPAAAHLAQLGVFGDERDDVGGLTDPNDVLVDNAHRLSLSRSQHHFGHNTTSVTTSLQPRPQPVGHARQRNPNLLH